MAYMICVMKGRAFGERGGSSLAASQNCFKRDAVKRSFFLRLGQIPATKRRASQLLILGVDRNLLRIVSVVAILGLTTKSPTTCQNGVLKHWFWNACTDIRGYSCWQNDIISDGEKHVAKLRLSRAP